MTENENIRENRRAKFLQKLEKKNTESNFLRRGANENPTLDNIPLGTHNGGVDKNLNSNMSIPQQSEINNVMSRNNNMTSFNIISTSPMIKTQIIRLNKSNEEIFSNKNDNLNSDHQENRTISEESRNLNNYQNNIISENGLNSKNIPTNFPQSSVNNSDNKINYKEIYMKQKYYEKLKVRIY